MKASILSFDNKLASRNPQIKEIWFYDYRTNVHYTLKKRPLRRADLQPFENLTQEVLGVVEGTE